MEQPLIAWAEESHGRFVAVYGLPPTTVRMRSKTAMEFAREVGQEDSQAVCLRGAKVIIDEGMPPNDFRWELATDEAPS